MVYGQESREYDSIKKISKEVAELDEAYFMIEKIKEVSGDSIKNFKEKLKSKHRRNFNPKS